MAWQECEEKMVEVAREWSEKYPNHFVKINEGMGCLFLEVHREGRSGYLSVSSRCQWGDYRDSYTCGYTVQRLDSIVRPLMELYDALTDHSGKYAVDLWGFHRGVDLTEGELNALIASTSKYQ
jgi:hypothetical protein